MAVETHATVGGQKIGLLFGLPAIEYIQKQIVGLVGNQEMTFNILQMIHIIYGGYLNWCKAENIEAQIPFRQFYNFVEDAAMANDMAEVTRIMKLFGNSKEVPEVVSEEKKRSSPLTGSKLKRSA